MIYKLAIAIFGVIAVGTVYSCAKQAGDYDKAWEERIRRECKVGDNNKDQMPD